MRDLTVESSTSVLQVVIVGGLSALPVLLVGPWGGVWGDRVDRRKLPMSIQTFMTVLAVLFATAGRLGPQTRAFRSIGSRASLQLRTCQRSLPGNRPTNASSTDCQYCSSRGVREAVLRETARQDCLTAQCFSTATQMFLSKRASYDESCKGADGDDLPPHDLVAGHTW